MSGSNLFLIIFTGVWCLVGVIFLGVGFGLYRGAKRRNERLRARAEGTITEVVRRTHHASDGGSVSWYPIVAFEVDGRTISLESEDGGGRKRFYEGQRVGVLYDPDDPTCFRLEGRDALALVGKIFLGVGALCVAIGIDAVLVVRFLAR